MLNFDASKGYNESLTRRAIGLMKNWTEKQKAAAFQRIGGLALIAAAIIVIVFCRTAGAETGDSAEVAILFLLFGIPMVR